jgi:hypothetical protein
MAAGGIRAVVWWPTALHCVVRSYLHKGLRDYAPTKLQTDVYPRVCIVSVPDSIKPCASQDFCKDSTLVLPAPTRCGGPPLPQI